jgi:hypothetical protein
VCHRVKEDAKDCRPSELEFPPKLGCGTPLLLSNRRQGQKNCAVGQIRPANDILDPIQEGRACRFKQHLFIIGVELPDRETTAARKPGECIGEPSRQAGQIIEGKQVAIVGCDHQLAFLARERSDRGRIGIDQRPEEL